MVENGEEQVVESGEKGAAVRKDGGAQGVAGGVDDTAGEGGVVGARCTPRNPTAVLGTNASKTGRELAASPFHTSPRNRPGHVPCMPRDAIEEGSSAGP